MENKSSLTNYIEQYTRMFDYYSSSQKEECIKILKSIKRQIEKLHPEFKKTR